MVLLARNGHWKNFCTQKKINNYHDKNNMYRIIKPRVTVGTFKTYNSCSLGFIMATLTITI